MNLTEIYLILKTLLPKTSSNLAIIDEQERLAFHFNKFYIDSTSKYIKIYVKLFLKNVFQFEFFSRLELNSSLVATVVVEKSNNLSSKNEILNTYDSVNKWCSLAHSDLCI